METRNCKLIKLKVLCMEPKILIIIFLSFCFCVQFSFSIDYISVWPYEIKFDYEIGDNNDALTIRDAEGDPATVPEWKYDDRSEEFAYIKGQNNRKIQVRFDSNCESMHLLINISVVSGNSIGTICNFFVVNYNKLEDWVTLT